MKRFDLRHLKNDFGGRLEEILKTQLEMGEVGIFLFEVLEFENVQKSADIVAKSGNELLNSLRFNEVDWTIVVKRVC
ncbi:MULTISPECIES: NADH-ubiquinone oxidoreductase subunit E family protein [Helicobacter]|uniref:NADH-ubiquinone oxidoreductase subunit E family protein n=1 Tax=Helicobacter colisuis TaxID=2949739 RepID=A0ABT0TVW5_9HELI|nr:MULTISPECIES: NADH-ubiquinone oxidoreductase subunit E family protein [Helicobacter]MCI2236294.1 NADH-ubiquinone oxidoreductase subunit E family protein [Helicobacter sp. CaF467b]MCI7046906.1 NADH-ubiquinone oxidoreductase subunit E family protein [Helicobacter sp.]MCI7765893.1 NADH-ubiquinone oxidoreductase subunit E family protein [Helicobacter sp.]MCL9819432.1 NADH-ubiquinone oxidoreductase subunit E family protein [Helicobacter colisuis]MCL9820478.1 NADH-ubiquinone oxidoreductase subuni